MGTPITNEQDRVILNGEWAEEIIHDVAWGHTENIDEFRELYEIDSTAYLRNLQFYQGNCHMRVIKRKSDGKLFGYPYEFASGFDSMEHELYPNGEDYGLEPVYNEGFTETLDGPYYVFLPVKEVHFLGYQIEEL